MKSTSKKISKLVAVSLACALGACAGERGELLPVASAPSGAAQALGPEGDYPIILGDSFEIDGKNYTPRDVMNYDEVGYIVADSTDGGVTIAHKTLPIPSYVEITSLNSGQTILARVERRGPMTNAYIAALSPAALNQLGVQEGDPIRMRRVNPPEYDRAKLRVGEMAALRAPTPSSLLAVLRKNLPVSGAADIASDYARGAVGAEQGAIILAQTEKMGAAKHASPATQADPAVQAPLPSAHAAMPTRVDAAPKASHAATNPGQSGALFTVQTGAFSSYQSAAASAKKLGGFVSKSGPYYRVHVGRYKTRGQGDAALAKLRSAGYRDAHIVTLQ